MMGLTPEKKERLASRRDPRGRRCERFPELDLSQIAIQANVSVAMVSAVLAGKRSPSLSLAMKLSKVTGIPIQEIHKLRVNKQTDALMSASADSAPRAEITLDVDEANPRMNSTDLFCGQCGVRLPLGSKFCNLCGAPVVAPLR